MKEYILARHGIPAILLSDKGSEYFNRLVTETCKLYGVTSVFSAAYHSRGHAMAERLNRTIEDRLKHTTNFACNDWDQWLPEVLFAIHTTPSAGTKFSPFRLLYGRDAIIPIYNALMELTTANTDHIANKQAYIMDREHATARANMIAYHARTQTQLNAIRKPSEISIGDLVDAHKTNLSRGKFAYSGPYMIISMTTENNNFRLHSFICNQVQRTIRNINELRKFTQAVSEPASPNGPYPQLLLPPIPTSGGDVATAAPPRGRGRPKGSKSKKICPNKKATPS
jgi:hypothetical protein